MLNGDLFDSAKDREIANLKRLVDKFKAYDKTRTEQYGQIVRENKWLKEELEIVADGDKRADTIRAQRAEIRRLNRVIAVNRMQDLSPKELDAARLAGENVELRKALEKAEREVRLLRKQASELVRQLESARREAGL